ncbi:hypothetical protein VQ042_24580 [Aurantimonas sp. A2-1-M11]|uniref:hypothetical protein n=1 Tax=Aurantimonas sp. A2-1-M11 TaxID=3113712 RepID=UPI002F91E35F
MTDSEYVHPRVLLDELSADQLRDLAADLSIQLASLHMALDSTLETGSIPPHQDSDASRERAAKIIAESIAWAPSR